MGRGFSIFDLRFAIEAGLQPRMNANERQSTAWATLLRPLTPGTVRTPTRGRRLGARGLKRGESDPSVNPYSLPGLDSVLRHFVVMALDFYFLAGGVNGFFNFFSWEIVGDM